MNEEKEPGAANSKAEVGVVITIKEEEVQKKRIYVLIVGKKDIGQMNAINQGKIGK